MLSLVSVLKWPVVRLLRVVDQPPSDEAVTNTLARCYSFFNTLQQVGQLTPMAPLTGAAGIACTLIRTVQVRSRTLERHRCH